MQIHTAKIRLLVMSLLISLVVVASLLPSSEQSATQQADVIIVGASIAGLSAAWEAGSRGARVLVVDMASVFGGHAVKSGGVVSIVNTPLQQARKLK